MQDFCVQAGARFCNFNKQEIQTDFLKNGMQDMLFIENNSSE